MAKNGKYLDWQSAMKLYTDGNERMDAKFSDILKSLNTMIEHQVESNTRVERVIKDVCDVKVEVKNLEMRVVTLEKDWIKITAIASTISAIITIGIGFFI